MEEDFDYEANNDDFQEEFEEEEVVEMTEEEYLKMLEEKTNALDLCSKLFVENEKEEEWKNKTESKCCNLTKITENHLDDLKKNGFFVCDEFIDKELSKKIYLDTLENFEKGQLTKAHSDNYSQSLNHDSQARDDYFYWIKESEKDPIKQKFVEIFDDLKKFLSNFIKFSGVEKLNEIQLALYPPNSNAKYVKHRDALPLSVYDIENESPRRLTCILYSGDTEWTDQHGGQLKVYHPKLSGHSQLIDPLLSRLVVFVSGAVDHEVMPVGNKHRVAISSWMH